MMHRVTFSSVIFHDYESRGWVHDAGDHITLVKRAGSTVTIEAHPTVLRAMMQDCVHRIECHDLTRSEQRSLIRFIEQVGLALETQP